ncbi:uncharacterized protein ARMOST_20236 [Armillaria ostoyae]|uniref:Uncharacterized protein n=1 Tax=Armillaria ostoyae TaxID=47428 RepID=A0A284RQT9_ARMOS|nr:uncharacterized protein ARMOST_14456 [Armillaria ostoyae]SJL16707.1 uncharacterized protein ARMOST_20236 [Armillaria ostoyae]
MNSCRPRDSTGYGTSVADGTSKPSASLTSLIFDKGTQTFRQILSAFPALTSVVSRWDGLRRRAAQAERASSGAGHYKLTNPQFPPRLGVPLVIAASDTLQKLNSQRKASSGV